MMDEGMNEGYRTALTKYGPLRYVESHVTYSTYRTRDRKEVHLDAEDGRELFELDTIDLRLEYQRWCQRWRQCVYVKTFYDYLKDKVVNPDWVEEWVRFCDDCASPGWEDDVYGVENGSRSVCEMCEESYHECAICEGRYRDTYNLLASDDTVCHGCVNDSCGYCDECEGYYRFGDDHAHGNGCCVSPKLEFEMPNNGGLLGNDTRIDVTLPAGIISEEGLENIAGYVRWNHGSTDVDEIAKFQQLSHVLETLGNEWQNKGGNYTKRLSRLAYKNYQLKVPPHLMTEVGNLASQHSQAVDVSVEFTRDLNQQAVDFYHEESCWWSSYSNSRCALKTNGGLGMRTFKTATGHNGFEYDEVTGRAWILPVNKLESGLFDPTLDTVSPDGYVVFNGYGDLSGYTPARVLALMTGLTYRKVRFCCSPMYVNGEVGYLVAREELAKQYAHGWVSLNVATHAEHPIVNQEREMSHA